MIFAIRSSQRQQRTGRKGRARLGPANESIEVAVVGSIWGFGDKTDGTTSNLLSSVGGYFINDISEVMDWWDSHFYEGMFFSMSE